MPLIIRWPDVITAGRLSAAPVTTVDFFPTLLEASGQPAAAESIIDGVSLVSHLRGAPPPARDAIFWHYPPTTTPLATADPLGPSAPAIGS